MSNSNVVAPNSNKDVGSSEKAVVASQVSNADKVGALVKAAASYDLVSAQNQGWQNRIKAIKGRQRLHWQSLAIATNRFASVVDSNGSAVDLSDCKAYHADRLRAESGEGRTQWPNWYAQEKAAYKAVISGETLDMSRQENRDMIGFLKVLLEAGYQLKAKESKPKGKAKS